MGYNREIKVSYSASNDACEAGCVQLKSTRLSDLLATIRCSILNIGNSLIRNHMCSIE